MAPRYAAEALRTGKSYGSVQNALIAQLLQRRPPGTPGRARLPPPAAYFRARPGSSGVIPATRCIVSRPTTRWKLSPAGGAQIVLVVSATTIVAADYDQCMSDSKERLSVSVDAALAEQARRAVAEGRAVSISSWVSDALRRQADHDARLRALDEFINAFEAEHGEITAEEIAATQRRGASKAVVSRGAA